MRSAGRSQVLDDLRERIFRIERSPDRAEIRGLSTGFPALDELWAQRGLQPGTLIEWLGEGVGEGSGAATLALAVAAHLLRREGAFVVIDSAKEFYPLAAAQLGVPLNRTVVVRPEQRMAALWAWEQALRCPSVLVTFGWVEAINDRLLRRLQLAAETGGGFGFLLRSPADQAVPSWASTRVCLQALPSLGDSLGDSLNRRLRVRLGRGQSPNRDAVEVELPHEFQTSRRLIPHVEASDVRLVSPLADPTAACRCAG